MLKDYTDNTIQTIEIDTASLQYQVANLPRDGVVITEMVEYYVQYCEIAEVAIASMLKCIEIQIDCTYRIHTRVAALSCRGVQVDPRSPRQGQLSGKHAFNEQVFRSLAVQISIMWSLKVSGRLRIDQEAQNSARH